MNAFKRGSLDLVRKYFIGVNIQNRAASLLDTYLPKVKGLSPVTVGRKWKKSFIKSDPDQIFFIEISF